MSRYSPGSVASILKLLLDIVYYILWALLGLASIIIVMIIFGGIYRLSGVGPELPSSVAQFLAMDVVLILPMAIFALATMTFVVNRLRRIVSTLIGGDPFDPANVNYLRAIGAGIAVFNLIEYAAEGVLSLVFTLAGTSVERGSVILGSSSVHLGAWISVLAFFVLAEAFREGTRLRDDQKFTI